MLGGIVDTGITGAGRKPGAELSHQAPLPRCFALAPLYDHLVTRQVDIRPLNDDGTLGDATVATVITGVDVESWARRFLGDLDRFLALSASAGLAGQAELGAMLADAAEGKRTIASAIANQLKGVLNTSVCEAECDPGFRKDLQAARSTLMQQLQASLMDGYDIPLIVQHDTDTSQAPSDLERHGSVPGSAESLPPGMESTRPTASLQNADDKPTARMDKQAAPRISAPLRIHPSPPVSEQAASPTFGLPIDVQQSPLWTYKLVLAHEFAAQDTVRVAAEFNLMRRPVPPPAPRFELVDILARYMAVADKLWTMLRRATASRPAGDGSSLNAIKTFTDFAATVAAHWSIRLPQDNSSEPRSDYSAQASHTFAIRVRYSANGAAIQSVSLTREQPQVGAGDMWPTVEVLLPEGSSVALLAQPSDPSSLTAIFVPKDGLEIPAFARQTFRLMWSGLNVSAVQNARSRTSVLRNEALLYDPSLPGQSTPVTHPAFLLKSAEAIHGNSAVPLIERDDPQEIKGSDLRAALDDAVQVLFPSDGVVANTRATWQLDYSYELAGSDASLGNGASVRARVPVALLRDEPVPGTAQRLAEAGQEWLDTQPVFEGGDWILNIVLRSGLEPDAVPLFRTELFYRIDPSERKFGAI